MFFLFFIAIHNGLDVPSIHYLNLKIQNGAIKNLKSQRTSNFDIESLYYFAIFPLRRRFILHF